MKGPFGITKNYRGITLTSIVAKVYYARLFNCIKPEIEKIHWKNQNGNRKNRSTTSQILIISRIIEVVCAKIPEIRLLFVDISVAFDPIDRGKMEQILQDYGLLQL